MEKNDKSKLRHFVLATVLSLAFLAFYYFSMNFNFFPIVMFAYMIALAVLSLVYVLYNRAMSRNGVTEDMLPVEWDIDKKRGFIEDGKRRLEKSRWMLIAIIALIVTFVVEAVTLFVVPLFSGWF